MFTTRKLIFSLSLVMAAIAAMSTSAAADDSGTQGTEKQSTQKSKEHSKARTTSKKQAADMKAATDFSTDMDVNSLLIQEFISHYENTQGVPHRGGDTLLAAAPTPFNGEFPSGFKRRYNAWVVMNRPQRPEETDFEFKKSKEYFLSRVKLMNWEQSAEAEKEITNEAAKIVADAQSPTVKTANGAMASFYTYKPFLYSRKNYPVANIHPLAPSERGPYGNALRSPIEIITLKQALDKATPGVVNTSEGIVINVDKNYPAVSDYAKCRIEAHLWVTAAAMHLAQENHVFKSEDDAKAEIDKIFDVMDSSPDLFSRIQEKTNQVFDNAVCMGTMSFYNDANKNLSLNCGTFVSDASGNQLKFVVNGRETLSSNGIDGKKFKIAMSQSAGNSQSDSIDFSESDKTSKSAATGRSAAVLSK